MKRAGFSLLGLLVLVLLISFLLPSERRIEASVKIEAPIQIVFDQVNDLRNWESWSPWKMMDPLMEMSYSNPPSGKGAFLKWRSTRPRIGRGKLILTEVIPNEKIVTAMDFEEGEDNTADFTFSQEKDAVKVTWTMIHRVGGSPIGKYKLLFQTGRLRQVFDDGLVAMKLKSEHR